MKSLKTPISKEKYTQIKSEMTSSYIAATKYFDKHLHNKDILILAKGQVFKASFLKKNFFHLCGVDSYIRPWEFYNKAAAGQLKPKHFTFFKDHTMSAAYTKSQALPLLFKAIYEGNTKNISILSELKATKRDLPFAFAFHIENPGEECSLCFDYSEDDDLIEAYSTSEENSKEKLIKRP